MTTPVSNKKKKSLCVIIPVHTDELTVNQTISLKQCSQVLEIYDIYLVYPADVRVQTYIDLLPKLLLRKVPTAWLNSLAAYNKMKCSIEFYKLFEEYEYMLTYELDSFVFSASWHKANAFNYDFIGAPWFEQHAKATDKSKIIQGLNSGFSIRNISRCIKVLKQIESIKPFWKIFKRLHLHRTIRFTFLLNLLNAYKWKSSGKNVYFFGLTTDEQINEDTFWSVAVPNVIPFRVAPPSDALKFSFEVNPSKLFKLSNNQLPLGCHAWEKYDSEFWRNHIK